MKWTITFFSLINFRAENYVMLQWTCLTRYNQRNWNLFFSPGIYSAFYHVNCISAVQWFTFNIFRGFLLSTCISLFGFPFILLVEHRFLSSSSSFFFLSQKLWNFYAINLSSCFGQSFVCLLQAHFHCRSRLYYWLNKISITKTTKHDRVQHATAKNKVPPHFCWYHGNHLKRLSECGKITWYNFDLVDDIIDETAAHWTGVMPRYYYIWCQTKPKRSSSIAMNILLQKFHEMEQKNVPLTSFNFYVCACIVLTF